MNRKDYGNKKFEYLDDFGSGHGAVIQNANFFYHALAVRDSTNKQYGVLIKINYQGDTLWQKTYKDPVNSMAAQAIAKAADNGFLISGSTDDYVNHISPCFVLKTDTNGNELWRKIINKSRN